MPKKREKTVPGRGEALLREWGVGDEVEALRGAWGRDPEADLAIAARLGHLVQPESAAALVEIESATTSKALRKEIRRSLFRLKQRGVAVPEAPAAAFSLGAPALEGYLSPSDGEGNLLVWIVKPRPGGLAYLFALINDPGGMIETDVHLITRKALRAARDDLFRKHAIRMIETDWRYCDHRMAEAHGWALARGGTVSGDYPRLRSEIVREPAAEVPHPIATVFDAAEVRDDVASLEHSAELLSEPEFRTWILPERLLRPHLDALHGAAESPLVLNKYQQEDRARGVIGAALSEIFGGAAAESYARRMRDMALVFHATQRPERARQALAVALALEASTQGGTGVPFCEALLQLSFKIHAEAEAESQAEQRSLIVTPQEARAAAERSRRGG